MENNIDKKFYLPGSNRLRSEKSYASQVLQISHNTINLWLKRSASTDDGTSASGEGDKVGDRTSKHFFLLRDRTSAWEHPDCANVPLWAKLFGRQSLILTNNLSTGMLRPYKIGMLPSPSCAIAPPISPNSCKSFIAFFLLPSAIIPVFLSTTVSVSNSPNQ